MKLPDDRPSVTKDVKLFLGNLVEAFDDSPKRRALAQLNASPEHRILALGFDDDLLDRLSRPVPNGMVGGVDERKAVQRASKRFADQLLSGRIDLIEGSAESIPFGTDYFDRAICVGRFERWADPPRAFAEVLRVLQPDGVFIIGLRTLDSGASKKELAKLNEIAKSPERNERLLAALRAAGFIRAEMAGERCAVARKPLRFT